MPSKNIFSIALFSMPWSLFSRPSIQLGALKGYLAKDPSLSVDTFHPYLSAAKAITTETYSLLSGESWAGEALYSSLLFPEQKEHAKKVFQTAVSKKKIEPFFSTLSEILESDFNKYLQTIDLSSYHLTGFSVCFSQLFSSLYAAKKIKELHPTLPIVFGGSSCAGKMGNSLIKNFPEIDYIIEGEGELSLHALCNFLQGKKQELPGNIITRTSFDQNFRQLADLNDLPHPDYDDYFKEVHHYFPGLPFQPTLPLEFSRGCWWNKCTFCNLNLQWQGYRNKKAKTLLHEVFHQHKKYQCIDFSFCDNALPPKEADDFFSTLSTNEIDYNFFAEIRAIKEPGKLALYKKGGLQKVQVGIEALSSSLLKKMRKGTSVMENIAIMKYCAESDIELDGNIIVEFPGTEEREIKETIANLEFVLPFKPLTAATFFLGSGSPIEQNPSSFKIHSICNHRNNRKLVPGELLKGWDMLILDHRGDKGIQKKLWHGVRHKLTTWQNLHETAGGPLLSYRDGGSFLLIRQQLPKSKTLLHRLKGQSRNLYLYCAQVRSLEEITHQFPSLPAKTILNFFQDLSNKKLLFQENNSFLALAIRSKKG